MDQYGSRLNIRLLHTLSLIVVILLPGCNKDTGTLSSREGEIFYDITYLENEMKKISTDMLPKKMVTRYKNDNYVFEIEGFFGLFVIRNVVNPKKSINHTQLGVLDKKFYYAGDMDDAAVGFGMTPGMKITYTDDLKDICGYTCEKVIITFKDSDSDTLEIYFTREIPIKNPNRTTPYKEIDGVLMEFYLQLHNIKMKLTANSVYERSVPDDIFLKKENYKKASKDYMEAVLFTLLDTE